MYGYDQVNCTISSYLSQEMFDLIPEVVRIQDIRRNFSISPLSSLCFLFVTFQPTTRKSCGRLLFLIVQSEGVLRAIDEAALNEIEDMKSFVDMEIFVKVGGSIRKTIDCFSFGGSIKLVNNDLSQLVEDYERIRALEISSLFIVE